MQIDDITRQRIIKATYESDRINREIRIMLNDLLGAVKDFHKTAMEVNRVNHKQ